LFAFFKFHFSLILNSTPCFFACFSISAAISLILLSAVFASSASALIEYFPAARYFILTFF